MTLSPFLNHHRPCLFPTEQATTIGKIKKRYRDQDIATPYEKLKSLPNAATFLKPGVTFQHRCHRLCPKRPRRRPRSQCRPRRTVPNHRLRVGTRRRVTPPPRTQQGFPNNPLEAPVAHPAHRTAGTTRHRLHSRIDSPPPDLPSYPSSMHPLVLHSTPRTPTRFTSSPRPAFRLIFVLENALRHTRAIPSPDASLFLLSFAWPETAGATHASPLSGSSDPPDQRHFARNSSFRLRLPSGAAA